jgi:two-component system sensor histidine kinase KdpD
MLRKASRIADRMGAPWFAVYVRTPREALEKIDAATHREIGNNLDLGRQLGGTSFEFKGADLVSTIAAFVKEYGITHIIMGRSRQPWYRRWFSQSLLDRLLQAVSGVDVIVLDAGSAADL